jgi:predicted transcriptional regulator
MGKRRAKAGVYFQILQSIKDSARPSETYPNGLSRARPTRVQGQANVPYDRFKKYVKELTERGLVELKGESPHQELSVTEKGEIYIVRYEIVADFLKTFRL